MLTRYIVETGCWPDLTKMPMVAPSRDFVAMKLQLDAMASAKRGEAAAAKAAADRVVALSNEPGQHPFAQQIITMQAHEAQAMAAQAAGNIDGAISMMKS